MNNKNFNGRINSGSDGERSGKENKGKTVILVVMITAFITTFTGSALNLSVPDIGDEFGVSAETVGWLVTGYTLAISAFSLPFGRLADITSRNKVLIIGIIVFSSCCIAAVFSVSMTMLIITRILQGVGAAMIFSTNNAVLADVFPEEKRGQVLGYSMAATYVGLSTGPVIGGFLNYGPGWRSIFVLTGVLGAAAFPAAVFGLRRRRGVHRTCGRFDRDTKRSGGHDDLSSNSASRPIKKTYSGLDVPGNILYILFIVLFMYGMSEIGKGIMPVIFVFAGLILGFGFVLRELRSDEPAVRVRMFREKPAYAFSNLAALMNYGATFAIGYLISVYLQVVMEYSSGTAGLIMISQPAIIAVLTPFMGKFSDRFSPFVMASLGMAFCAVGTSLFIFVSVDTVPAFIITALAVTGVGFSFFSSPNTNAVMSCVEKEDYGVATSVLATMRSVGNTISMVIVTMIVSRYIADIPLAEAQPEVLVKVVRISFMIFTGICIVGVFVSLKKNIKDNGNDVDGKNAKF